MFAHVLALWEKMRTSLWFVPTTMVLVAALLAVLLVQNPLPFGVRVKVGWWLHQGDGADAANLISTLLGALIPMTALLISITMVVLTLAAGQLGPRLISNFMSDRQTQMTLGLFIATIVYLMIVLWTLQGDMQPEEVPSLGVSIGALLVLACVGSLIFFVHSLARSIVSDTMIARIGADLDLAIRRQWREEPEHLSPDEVDVGQPGWGVGIGNDGYVETVDYDSLVKEAKRLDARFELFYRPGDFVISGTVHARIVGPQDAVEKGRAALASATVVGARRTAAQDLEYSIRQLVEIAVRALSPGVNDEFSALAVVDRLGASLAVAVRRHPVHRVLCDRDGVPRVVRRVATFAGLCKAAFNQIRQASGRTPAVQIRMIETLGNLLSVAEEPAYREVLRHHLDLVLALARRSVGDPSDLEVIEGRYRDAADQIAERPISEP